MYGCIIVFVLLYAREWVLQKKLQRVDEYQLKTYHQNQIVRAVAHNLQSQLDKCTHNYDYAHEQCRAAERQQIRHLLSAVGAGPIPDMIYPEPRPEQDKTASG
jgi:hypothetical protein